VIVVGVFRKLVVMVVSWKAEVHPLGCTYGVVSAVAMTIVLMVVTT
jgi:hypothetical protein